LTEVWGRGDCDDFDGAPQRRRSTASARRQQVLVTVADEVPVVPGDLPVVPAVEPAVAIDEPMVDADAQNTGVEADAQDTGAEAAADEAEGFPGGPRDLSVLREYVKNFASSIWSEEVFIIFNLSYLLSILFY